MVRWLFVVSCAIFLSCGAGDGQGERRDVESDVATDVRSGSDVPGVDPDTDASDIVTGDAVDVSDPSGCVTGSVCADGSDCQPGERCNETLLPPTCQKLYCSTSGEPCDPGVGDDLCASGLHCIDAESPFCSACVPACENRECGTDGCGGGCGKCEEGALCTEAGVCDSSKPMLRVVPAVVDLGDTPLHQTYEKEITLRNVGTADLEIYAIDFVSIFDTFYFEYGASKYGVSDCSGAVDCQPVLQLEPPTILMPDEATFLAIGYTAETDIQADATLTIYSNDPGAEAGMAVMVTVNKQ